MIGQAIRLAAVVTLSGCLVVALVVLANLLTADTLTPPPAEPCVYCEDVRGRDPKDTPHRDIEGDPICRHCAVELGFET